MKFEHLITIEPEKRGGKPCIRGLRIAVADILDYLAAGMTADEILADFPELTGDDIRACLEFAANRERRLFQPPADGQEEASGGVPPARVRRFAEQQRGLAAPRDYVRPVCPGRVPLRGRTDTLAADRRRPS
jgi:uncharacterized protein (DUF433 family)